MTTKVDVGLSNVDEKFQNGDGEVEVNGNDFTEDLNGTDSKNPDGRIIRKAKRFHRQNSGSDALVSNGETVHANQAKQALAVNKNSRKSRDGRGRGLPKKGGAGGKGTWGAPGDEMLMEERCKDANDPNYDSESEDEYVVEKIDLEVTPEELSRVLQPVISEYYNHGDTSEVQETLQELKLRTLKPKVIEMILSMALDHKCTHRELSSILISDLYGKVLTSDDIASGFDDVLNSLSDLTIDTPEAPVVIGQFIARAVADDCLPPKYMRSYKGNVECEHTVNALEKAELLLSKKHGIVRLDNIWGTGGGIRPVKYLIKQMVMLLKEYLSSGDIHEATQCLQELEVPHFHHEVVYEATMIVLEDGSPRAANMMCNLLKSWSETLVLTTQQITQGFKRIYDALPDITLDVPAAYTLLEQFATLCHQGRVIGSDIFQDLPQRGRKRFVSEGDGGRLKEQIM
ncbi:programmed cell death protein 4-like [Argopecten irradians]|uniref:programmed cell death protein 4-like n=1 Tax=Argopecten irradians TaxID=31199 RepID=UPI00371FD863